MNGREWAIRWRRQLLCLGAGVLAAVMAAIASGSGREAGYELSRSAPGAGEQEYEFLVEGLVGGEQPLAITVGERAYTREEALAVYEAILEELPERILGENQSLEEVRGDLQLLDSLPEYGVRLRWQSSDPELLDSFGRNLVEEISEEGEELELRLEMTDGRWPQTYLIPVRVKPPFLTENQRKQREFLSFIEDREGEQREQELFRLPEEYEGKALRYKNPRDLSFLWLVVLGAVGAAALTLKERKDLERREQERKAQMLLDYSEVLSRLIILLGAGLSIRGCWNQIAEDYRRGREAGTRPPRYIYEEICATGSQLASGVPEQKAFAEFGRRCGLLPYMKLGGLLEQNCKNGAKRLRETLRLQMADAFEQRRHQAKRLGEEAGTKLLVPLFLLLLVVMVMISVPAMMEFR